MVKIAVFNQKGGVTKTTSTANLAVIYAERLKKRVLAIDCDAQANLSYYLTNNLGGSPKFAEAIKNGTSLEDCIEPVSFTKGKTVYNPTLSMIESSELIDYLEIPDASLISSFLEHIDEQYDVCFMDCGPQKTSFNVLALAACDYVIVPMDPQMVNINSIKLVDNFLKNTCEISGNHAVILGAFLSIFDMRASLHKQMREIFERNLGDMMFKTVIRKSRSMEESYSLALPIWYYARRQAVCGDYIKLAEEIDAKIKNRSDR